MKSTTPHLIIYKQLYSEAAKDCNLASDIEYVLYWRFILVVCIISVLYKIIYTPSPLLPPYVSMYIKQSPIGGRFVASVSLVGEFVIVGFIKFVTFQLLFLSLQMIFQ